MWRYSDWDGWVNEVRESQPHIWRWRDWIVESLNRDTPYSEMIVAMLAADEAWPGDDDAVARDRLPGSQLVQVQSQRLAGKHRRAHGQGVPRESRSIAPSVTTINTTRSLRASITRSARSSSLIRFAPINVPGQPDTTKAGLVRVYDGEPAAPTYLFERGDDKKPVKDKPVAPAVPKILQLQAKLGAIQPVALPPETYYPGLKPFVREEAIAQAKREVQAKEAELIRAERAFAEARDPSAAELGWQILGSRETSAQGRAGRARFPRGANRGRHRQVCQAAAIGYARSPRDPGKARLPTGQSPRRLGRSLAPEGSP